MTQTPLKILIVGTGRCGTGYLAQCLENAGFSCGHEAVFNHWDEDTVRGKLLRSTFDAESSWAAAAFLGADWLGAEVKVIHLTRSPKAVIKSFFDINFFSDGRVQKPLNQVVYRNTSIRPESQARLASSVAHYYEWNAMIVEKLAGARRPSLQLRLEDLVGDPLSVDALSRFIGAPVVLPAEVANRKVKEKLAMQGERYDEQAALVLMKAASERYGNFGYAL